MNNKEKIDVPYTYDTPTGIVEKEGQMFRGMAKHDGKRPLFVKILTIFFSLLIFVLPGIALSIMGFRGVISFATILGLLMLIAGIVVIYQNIRK